MSKDFDLRFSAEPVSLQKRADSEQQFPNITGYAAVFWNPDDPGTEYQLDVDFFERVSPGAFSRALKEGDDTRCCFNHDFNWILGRTTAGTLKLRQDAKGLLYECDPPETQQGKSVTMAIERGDVTGSSFMFLVDEQVLRTERRGNLEVLIREITSVTLFECGPVVMPAFASTTATLSSRSRAVLEDFRHQRSGTPRLNRAKRRLLLSPRSA